jgi:hypothetical protein
MAEYKPEFLETKNVSFDEIIPGGELTMREPTRGMVYEIKRAGDNEEKTIEAVIKIAPEIVISHNVEKDGQAMNTKELLMALFQSLKFTMIFVKAVTDFFISEKKTEEN